VSAFEGGQLLFVPPVHAPLEQVCPVLHALPQAPQFAVSVCMLTQVVPHSVCPLVEHWQVLFEQV
jgi:hypothetical protein